MKRSKAQKALHSLILQLVLCPLLVLSQDEKMEGTVRMNILGDGESFHPILEGRAWKREKPLFWEWRFSRTDHETQWMNSAVLINDWKLLQHTGTNHVELYHVLKDSFENHDLANAYPDQAAKMKQQWQSWKQTLPQ